MKASNIFALFLTFVSIAFFLLPKSFVEASLPVPVSTMKFGDYGDNVLALQKILNLDEETKISLSGPGSPGNETKYFGSATQKSVIKFQEKYKDEILKPANLSFGTGYVGRFTLNKLKFVSENPTFVLQNNGKVPEAITVKDVATTTKKDNVTVKKELPISVSAYVDVPIKDTKTTLRLPLTWDPKTEKNPNLENYDYVISSIKSVGKEQGYPDESLDKVKSLIDEQLATTTNLKALFVKENLEKSKISFLPQEIFAGLSKGPAKGVNKLLSDISDTLLPKAEAQGMDYGAQILSVFLCTCSGNWLMTLRPFGMGPVLLTHYSGAQSFLNFNVPFSLYLIGKYTPGGAPCMIIGFPSCYTIPSQGMTTPFMGSS
jgi:peptidoglycan hydrolase-like protein with peptidoglycan-binding domain